MAYSRAYQTVTAGRVREDEAIAFFGQNKTAVGSGVRQMKTLGGKTEPTIVKDFLNTEFVGKKENRTVANLTSYKPNSNQTGS